MKTLYVAIIALALASSAFAWNCPAGQIRQQAPAGTPTTTPFYDVVEGIAFICVSNTPPPPTPNGGSNTNTNTNNNTNTNTVGVHNNVSNTNTLNQTQQQQQQQNQTQTATGGNATSSAQGGNAASTSSATENGNNSNNTTVEASKIPVATAIAPPVLPTVPCLKGYGGAVQTMAIGGSFGGGKIDEGCDQRELARSFSNISKIAQCKVLVSTKAAKKAGVTLEDCIGVPVVPEKPRAIAVAEPVAPVIVVVEPALSLPAPVVILPKKRVRAVKHLRPDCQNVVQLVCK